MSKDKKKPISWTLIITIGMILLFLLILVFGFNSEDEDSINNYVKHQNNKESNELKIIRVTGLGEEITITNAEPSTIYITGMKAIVHFSKSSNPKEIYLSGMESVAYLCEGVHTPSITATGLNAKAIYEDC